MTLIETTSAARPHARRQTVLALELVGLYLVPPTCFLILREAGFPVPAIPAILAGFVVFAVKIVKDPTFDRRTLWRRPSNVPRIVGMFVVGAAFLVGVTLLVLPDKLFRFPLEQPALWLAIMIYYPLLSVIPQEVIYRAYFFHRYRGLFGTEAVMVVASAAAFGWVHVMFGHWLSVVLAMLGGMLFAWTWTRTRSLWAVAFEHALYGCFAFTVGLRPFFYTGAPPF